MRIRRTSAVRPGIDGDDRPLSEHSRSTDAPTDEQRFAPVIYGIPTVVFDFRTGQSVEISPLTGGNPDLRTARRDTQMVGVSMGPFPPWRLSGGLNFRRSEATNESGGLPGPTSDIEAAFPERFQRDAEGRLVGIDQRPPLLRSPPYPRQTKATVSLALR